MIEYKQRVRIIGPPGSYTTALARAIGHQSNLPVVNLHVLEHAPHPYSELQKSLAREKWIVTGSFAQEWAASTVDDATLILYVNTARFTCFIRLYLRLLRNLFSKAEHKQFHRDMKTLLHHSAEFAKWEKKHRGARTKLKKFATVDEAYEFFVRETAPDLFL